MTTYRRRMQSGLYSPDEATRDKALRADLKWNADAIKTAQATEEAEETNEQRIEAAKKQG